jgi:tetratricopeptide (TPR) repeat protein
MRALTTALLAMVIAAGVAAQPQPVDTTVRSVRRLIESGRAAEALKVLQGTDVTAASKRDQARILFYTARAHEELGDADGAIAGYEKATQIEPTYGAALNNLAQMLLQRGQTTEAARLLKQAAALDDPHRLLYLDNYAAAAEKAGDVVAARIAYGQLAVAQPDNVAAQVNAIRLLDDPKRMADLLTKLARLGEVRAARSLALDLLSRPFDESARRSFLSVVAGTLANDPIDPRLNALRDDPQIGVGVRELLALAGGNPDPEQLRWWRTDHPDERFAGFIRNLGVSVADKGLAERYFKLALDYSRGTDPDAFVELADLYYSQQRIGDLDALAHEYEAPMAAAKVVVIAARDYSNEYRFHVALGTMYAYLGRWGSEREPASAIFQLAQAQRAAADYNRGIRWGPKIPIDPKTIDLLATGYAKTQHADQAVACRIDAAQALLEDGRKAGAVQLLKPLQNDPSPIRDAAMRARFEAVVANSKKPIVQEFVISYPQATSVDLASLQPIAGSMPAELGKQITHALANYVTADSDDARDQAERTLSLLGVTGLDPTTMSRTTGELLIPIDGKPVRYRYAVHVSE